MTAEQSCAAYFKGTWNHKHQICTDIPADHLQDVTNFSITRKPHSTSLLISIGTMHPVMPEHGLLSSTTVNLPTFRKMIAAVTPQDKPIGWQQNTHMVTGYGKPIPCRVSFQTLIRSPAAVIRKEFKPRDGCFFTREDERAVAKKFGWKD